MKRTISTAFLAVAASAAHAGLIDLDFQGGPDPGFVPPGETEPGFTAFELPHINVIPADNAEVNPSITVDGVTFAITGTVGAFGLANEGNDLLDQDFLFLSETLGYSDLVGWSLSGLAPVTEYELTWYAAPEGASDRIATITSGFVTGDVINDGPDLVMRVRSDISGAIIGTAQRTGPSIEANIAGLSVRLPEPSTAVLAGLTGLLAACRRR